MDTLVSTSFSYDIQSSHAHQTHPQQRYASTHSPAKRGERRDDLVMLCETHSRGPGNGDSGRGGSTESDHFCGCGLVNVKLFTWKVDCVAWRRGEGGGIPGRRRAVAWADGGEVSLCNTCLNDVAKYA